MDDFFDGMWRFLANLTNNVFGIIILIIIFPLLIAVAIAAIPIVLMVALGVCCFSCCDRYNRPNTNKSPLDTKLADILSKQDMSALTSAQGKLKDIENNKEKYTEDDIKQAKLEFMHALSGMRKNIKGQLSKSEWHDLKTNLKTGMKALYTTAAEAKSSDHTIITSLEQNGSHHKKHHRAHHATGKSSLSENDQSAHSMDETAQSTLSLFQIKIINDYPEQCEKQSFKPVMSG